MISLQWVFGDLSGGSGVPEGILIRMGWMGSIVFPVFGIILGSLFLNLEDDLIAFFNVRSFFNEKLYISYSNLFPDGSLLFNLLSD